MEQKYKVIALYGKGGSGKNYILNKIFEIISPNLHKVIGTTTRPPRKGEVDGVDYYFTNPDEFANDLVNGELVEAAAFRGWYYGTNIAAFDKNKINIGIFNDKALDILLQDARFEIVSVYIETDSKTRLIRMLNREDEVWVEEVIRRYQADEKDFNEFFNEHPDLTCVIFNNTGPLSEEKLEILFQKILDQFNF